VTSHGLTRKFLALAMAALAGVAAGRRRRTSSPTEAAVPVGTDRVCLLQAPFEADDCYRVTVTAGPDGSAGRPVVGGEVPAVGRPRPRSGGQDPFCGSCW